MEDKKVRIDLKSSTRRRLSLLARKRETWDEALKRLMDAAAGEKWEK